MISHWTHYDVLVNGAKFHYVRTGTANDSKPVLVLVHGFSDNGMCWLPVARDLEDEFNVILPDARGHGLSQRLQPGEQIDHAADLAGLIQVLELKQPVVGGHSMGANTSATMATRFPGVARALILEDPGWRDWTPEPQPGTQDKQPPANPWFDWLSGLQKQTVEQVMEKGRADNPTWPEIEMRPWAESKKQLDLNILQGGIPRMNWRDQARGITVPVLMLTGDVDKGAIVTPEIVEEVKTLIPQIRVVHIPGVGHSIRRENYPAFIDAVKSFLKDL